MKKSLIGRNVVVRQGAYLPHWTREGATYAVCFRLADSLPQHVAAHWKQERAALVDAARAGASSLTVADKQRLDELFSTKVERYLDTGAGACWLQQPEIAPCVAKTLRHFDSERYCLHAWCIMPNHVHIVVQTASPWTLPEVVKSWKGFSGREANGLLGRSGDFWQAEYYDHLVRHESDYIRQVRYVLGNPQAAGLADWLWVWASKEAMARVS